MLTCDNVTELDMDLLVGEYVAHGEPACMLVPVEPVEGLDGDFIFHDDHVVTRLSRSEPAPTYCSGIQIVNPAKVLTVTEPVEDFGALWEQLIPLGQLRSSRVYPETWFSVDSAEHLRVAEGNG